MDKFWSSVQNKVLLQGFVQDYFTFLASKTGVRIIFSGRVVNNLPTDCKNVNGNDQSMKEVPELKMMIEEADARIIPHIAWHLKTFNHCNEVLIESNDTDVVVYVLFYMHYFVRKEHIQIWVLFGKGKNASYLPIHDMYKKLGYYFCKGLSEAHIGSGCDYLSKIGTKKGALKANPMENLKSFGEGPSLDNSQIKEAERYLVMTYSNPKAPEQTFDELRYPVYMQRVSVLLLPPSSNSVVNGHIYRWWYLYKKMSNLLNESFEDIPVTDYGWFIEDEDLCPVNCQIIA